MQTLIDQARGLDRRINVAKDPAEMAELIRQRRLVRAGLDFEQAMRAFEQAHPVQPVRESFYLMGPLR